MAKDLAEYYELTLPSGAVPTMQQMIFAREYVANGGKAMKAAEVAKISKTNTTRFSRHPTVKELIGYLARERFEVADVNVERVLRELYNLATVTIGDLFLEDGTPIPLHMLPPSVKAAVKEYDLTVEHSKDEKGRDVVTRRAKVKMHDKVGSLDRLARYLRMFDDDGGDPTIPVEFVIERES